MNEMNRNATDFIGYEYKTVTAKPDQVSLYLDCYQNFGWFPDENLPCQKEGREVVVKLKRDRKIINKTELTRLQRHFEGCVAELAGLEKSKTSKAMIATLTIGLLGTVFMAGSTFAVTHEPPVIWLCVVLAAPGFAGWISPYFIYREMVRRMAKKVNPLIEQKYDEIYEICEKGSGLLIK